MEEKVALFLSRFSKLKDVIKNSPRNLTWLAKERTDLQELCSELEQAHKSIAHFLASKDTKHTFVTVPFENEWNEYERIYQKAVSETAKPAEDRRWQTALAILQEAGVFKGDEEGWIKESGKSPEEYWEAVKDYFRNLHGFNPVTDDPASLMRGSKNLVAQVHDAFSDSDEKGNTLSVMSENCNYVCFIADEDEDGYYQKVLAAWEFFEKTLGLDLTAIYKKWRSVPEVFIQRHVAQLENAPVVGLYNEAVRSYVFGSVVASMAMCRALMEHILKKHYKIQGKDLENIVAMAEVQYPHLKKLKMQEMRRTFNDMLHNYEGGIDVEDQVLLNYFRTIKYMIQTIPNRK